MSLATEISDCDALLDVEFSPIKEIVLVGDPNDIGATNNV